jgi:hypothetical protein
LYGTCLRQVGEGIAWLSPLVPRSSSSRRCTAGSPSGPPSPAAPRPAAHRDREDPRQPPPRRRGRRPRPRRELHRLRPRPGRHAGRHGADGAPAVHDRRPRRGRPCPTTSTATTSSWPRPAPTSTCKFALDINAEVYEFLRTVSARTASASGSRARASSTRSCSRTTPSPAG